MLTFPRNVLVPAGFHAEHPLPFDGSGFRDVTEMAL
jgi:hypothetical protein